MGKQPLFEILCRNETVWAEVVNNGEAGALQPRIPKRSPWNPSSVQSLRNPITASPLGDLFFVWLTMERADTANIREIISMEGKDSGDI